MSLGQRRITTAAEMRALAHPVRLRLLELLGSEGAFTASEAGRRLGETPANVSWHLRKLAEFGFVRQTTGTGRARPWKFVGQSLSLGEDAEDPRAATALSDLLLEREFQVLRSGIGSHPQEPTIWRDATTVLQQRLWLTPQEARDLNSRLTEVLLDDDLVRRNQEPDRRPAGARLMALMGWVVPYGPVPQAPASAVPLAEDDDESEAMTS